MLASFWKEALGYKNLDRWVDGDMIGVEIAPTDGNGDTFQFLSNPEPKTAKNRWHLDLRPEDQAEEVARLVSLGATKVDVGQKDASWVVLADPEGNEFCVLRALEPDSAG